VDGGGGGGGPLGLRPGRLKMKLLYTGQCGFYVYSVAALLVWETRRKDFGVMMTHHIITIFLITYSYADGYVYAALYISHKRSA
jgi:ceramide synthetase